MYRRVLNQRTSLEVVRNVSFGGLRFLVYCDLFRLTYVGRNVLRTVAIDSSNRGARRLAVLVVKENKLRSSSVVRELIARSKVHESVRRTSEL